MRNLLLILLSINALSCGKKKEATPTTVDIGRRGANITAIPFVNYNGQIRIDAKGDKAIYLSGRNQTDESVKIWKWESTSAPQTSVLASTADFGSAHLAAISPDGGWISFVAVGADGKQTIYVQNFVNDKLFAQVTFDEYEKGVIERLSFSTNTNNSLPLLAIQYSRVISGGTAQVFIDTLSFTATTTTVTLGQPVRITPAVATSSLRAPCWIGDPAANQYTIAGFEETSSSSIIGKWTVNLSSTGPTPSSENQLQSFPLSQGAMQPVLASGGNQLAFIKRILYHGQTESGIIVEEPSGNRAPNADGTSSKGTILISEALGSFDTAKNQQQDLPSTQYQVADVRVSLGGSYIFSLGAELIACDAGDLYGTFFLIHDVATKKNARIVLVANDDHSAWTLSQDPCSIVTSSDKMALVATRTEMFDLAVEATSGSVVYKLLLLTAFDGVEKMILAQFGLNADLTLTNAKADSLP